MNDAIAEAEEASVTYLEQFVSADVITEVGGYVATFFSVGLFLGLMFWAVGYVVHFIQLVMRGGA